MICGIKKVDFEGGASKFRSAAMPKVQQVGCWDLPGSCKALFTSLGPGAGSLAKPKNSQGAELPEIKFILDICFWHLRDI